MTVPPKIPVLAAVINRDSKFLICQRPREKRHGGLWEFPGGKLESSENWEQAAIRELREELDVSVTSVDEPLLSIQDEGSPFTIVFVPVEIDGEPKPLEHADLRWVESADLPLFDLAPSDRRFAKWLLNQA